MLTTLHRFTPPTCTLEIRGKKSPLSDWTDRALLKKLQFQLSFDDPRVSTEQQVTITGNQTELEQLNAAVDCYIQHQLHRSLSANQVTNKPLTRRRPYLVPDGLVNHQLFLGKLTNDAVDNRVKLSTVQLFDLATALESYVTQIRVLPALKQDKTKVVFLWGSIVAVTAVAVVLGAIALKSPLPNVATSTREESPTEIPELDEVVPPQIPEASKAPAKPRLKEPEPIASSKPLPPPPAVDTPKPKPNIPDPADYPLSQVGKQSGLNDLAQEQVESAIAVTPKADKKQNSAGEKSADETDSASIVLEPEPEKRESGDRTSKTQKTKPELATDLNSLESGAIEDKPDTGFQNQQDSGIIKDKPIVKPTQLEISNYFRARWQPPADLKQSLEYRLYLNSDGSIDKVVSLGKASKLYLSQTNIPVQGEKFISPTKQKLTVRLLLNPNGTVKAFKE